jgi:hypothetical protein
MMYEDPLKPIILRYRDHGIFVNSPLIPGGLTQIVSSTVLQSLSRQPQQILKTASVNPF